MKMATLITAYKQPYLLERMLKTMQHEGFDFYIHLDKKANQRDFEYLATLPNVYFLKKRIDIKWAGYTMIQALLSGMREICSSGIHYDFVNHMSGQCYPIKPACSIYDYFNNNIGKNFLSCYLQSNDWQKEAAYRYQKYHFPDAELRGSNRAASIISFLLPRRRLPFNLTLYGSDFGAYWTITSEAATYILDYMEKHPEAERFFKKTWGPDEFLFNTILMNSPHKENVINNNFRYIDWSEGGSRPKILTKDDYSSLSKSGCFIARKFDLDVDSAILDAIDKNLLQHRTTHG
jgi:hypothetical protein